LGKLEKFDRPARWPNLGFIARKLVLKVVAAAVIAQTAYLTNPAAIASRA
jgi:hypothetical protein